MYVYPSSSAVWAPIISAKKANPSVPIVVIANVNSGPGSSIDANYATMIPQLQAAGVTVIGYVYTNNGKNSSTSMKSHIYKWNSWYKVKGIFLDGMPDVTGKETYYSTLTKYSKSLGMSLVIGDPGTDTVSSYIGTVDTLVTYNNLGYPSLSFLSGGWHASYPKSNFAYISYGDATLHTTFEQSAARYVQYEFITNLSASAPFNGLPSYFSTEVAALSSATPVPTATPTTKPSATPTTTPSATPTATPTVAPTAVPTSVASTNTDILIPLYIYPSTSTSWSAAISAKQANPNASVIAIVNVNSGPGTAIDTNYVSAVAQLKAAGVTVFGYIHTSYGAQSVASLESQMSQWVQWYGPSGMFFDEMANTTGYESYYTTLTKYAKSLGLTTTIGNPGTDSIPSYVGTVDTMVIYENSGMPTLSFLSGGWHASYAPSNFAFIAYGVSSLDTTLERSEAPYVRYEYITSGTAPNPYDLLPSYLTSEVTNV